MIGKLSSPNKDEEKTVTFELLWDECKEHWELKATLAIKLLLAKRKLRNNRNT